VTGHEQDKTPGNAYSTWPKRQVLADGTEIIAWASMHPSTEELNHSAETWHSGGKEAPNVERPWEVEVGRAPAPQDSDHVPDDDWLDDYEEGSTPEEVLHRLKNGMVISYLHDDTEAVAAEAIRRAADREPPDTPVE
jgi:hypothetical protein